MQKFLKLSREEMKNILGGDTPPVNNPSCKIGNCSLYVAAIRQTLTGTCDAHQTSNYSWYCVCKAGGYETNNGGTGCVFAA